MAIKNVIFDLGGVIINLDRLRAVEGLKEIGLNDAASLLGEYEQRGPFLDLETGEITSSDLFDIMLPQCKEGTTCTQIRDAFEKFLLDIPVERLRMLDRLRKNGYKLYVLSNTNPIMYNHWIDREFRKDGKSINDYFDGIVTSFQEKMCKPSPEIFKRLIERYKLNPEETLMLDDSEANVAAAKSVGLQARRVMPDGPDSILEICNV